MSHANAISPAVSYSALPSAHSAFRKLLFLAIFVGICGPLGRLFLNVGLYEYPGISLPYGASAFDLQRWLEYWLMAARYLSFAFFALAACVKIARPRMSCRPLLVLGILTLTTLVLSEIESFAANSGIGVPFIKLRSSLSADLGIFGLALGNLASVILNGTLPFLLLLLLKPSAPINFGDRLAKLVSYLALAFAAAMSILCITEYHIWLRFIQQIAHHRTFTLESVDWLINFIQWGLMQISFYVLLLGSVLSVVTKTRLRWGLCFGAGIMLVALLTDDIWSIAMVVASYLGGSFRFVAHGDLHNSIEWIASIAGSMFRRMAFPLALLIAIRRCEVPRTQGLQKG